MQDREKISITGKTLVISDLHIGLKKANQSKLSIIVKVFKNFLETIDHEGVSNVICCGDIFHSRVSLDLQALNVGLKLISALAKKCKCYLIVGNHDQYFKSSGDVNSTNVFRHMENVVVVDETTEAEINGEKALFVPWLGKTDNLQKGAYDILFGHFDISGKYLIASYIEEHSRERVSDEDIQEMLSRDELLSEGSSIKDIRGEFAKIKESSAKSGDLVGDFVELAKPYGTIYAGHIHANRMFVAKTRMFIFIGSPYQQNFGEIGCVCGYYVLDEKNKRKFFATRGVPEHIRLKVSDILKDGVENFDFSKVRGNIVQKIYDIDVDVSTEVEINRRISDSLPFEEALPEYSVSTASDSTEVTNESLETIRKSKMDYIRNYIDSMDDEILAKSDIKRERLYKMLEGYYNAVVENDKT